MPWMGGSRASLRQGAALSCAPQREGWVGEMAKRYKALVAGASGIVGRRLAEHLLTMPEWEVVALSRKEPIGGSPVPRIAVDLTDAADTQAKLGGLSDITHVFYIARYDHPEGQPEPVEINVGMFKNLLDTITTAAPDLQHVHLGSGHKNYGFHMSKAVTPAKETTPRGIHPSFYFRQEDYMHEKQRGQKWSWSTARSSTLCDTAPGITRSVAGLIQTYASISKELGLPLRFPGTPGNYNALYQVTDATLLAKAMAWMSTEPRCANQNINITNGDIFRWSELWPLFADYFGMELGPVQTVDLPTVMADKGPVWDRIVEKHGLIRQPLDAVTLWSYGRHLWSHDWDIVTDTTKSRLLGFHEYVETGPMFLRLFDHFRREKVFPAN